MSLPLLKALTKYYKLVNMAAVDPTTVIPPELDFVPGPRDDLESIIWVLTYAFMLRHQESLQGLRKAPTNAMFTSFMVAYLILDSPRSAILWCSMVPMLSLTNLKNGFQTPLNADGSGAR